jgi:hypothetical protein
MSPPGPAAPREAAAYLDVTLEQPPDLGIVSSTAVPSLVLAFVTAGDGCVPSWGGVAPLDDPAIGRLVTRVRARTGDVRVSFGGERGTDLAERCETGTALANVYEQVVRQVSPSLIDFDVEGGALTDEQGVHRRDAAIAAVQAAARREGRPLRVAFTLPAEADGLTGPARALLADAKDAGVRVDVVNAMTMDYASAPADPVRRAMDVAASTAELIRRMWPDLTPTEAWRRVWLTPMIGVNDVRGQVFGLADATRLAAQARDAGVGGLAFWSLARDGPCGKGQPAGVAADTCSGVPQRAGDFGRAFAAFATPGQR